MKRILVFVALTACFFMTTGCGSQPKEFTEKKIIVASNETVVIKELDLAITNSGCGRKWISEGDNPSFERPFCDLVVKHKDSTINFGQDFKPVHISNIEIIIDRMNPWGREEDSVPPGGCRLWVRKSAGR